VNDAYDKSKFSGDWAFSLGSFAILGISGLAFNGLIAHYFDASVLGKFNQVFAIYIFSSQIGTFGVQYSVLKHCAEYADDPRAVGTIAISGLPLVLLATTLMTVGLYCGAGLVGQILSGDDVRRGLLIALPAMWCFPVNKFLLSTLNGLQHNKTYSVLTSLRYLMMLAALIGIIAFGGSGVWVPAILSVAEVLLCGMLILGVFPICARSGLHFDRSWMRRHADFGWRSMWGGIAVELNTRIDVLILAAFASASEVGVYTFAAMLVEGGLQLSVVTRRVMDPILTRFIVAKQTAALQDLLIRGRNLGAVVMILISIIGILLYGPAASLITQDPAIRDGGRVFAILMVGASVFGAYATFGGLLVQAGKPGLQTLFNFCILAANTSLNGLLVPFLAVDGAAIATSGSFIVGALLLRYLVARHLALKF